jgi:hypothetical protein
MVVYIKKSCGKKNSSRIPSILENNISINNPREKACIFNSYFVTQTQIPGANSVASPDIPLFQTVTFLARVYANEDNILALMRNVDIRKACGFDGIGNRIIKSCSDGIYSFFTKLINLSLALGPYCVENG